MLVALAAVAALGGLAYLLHRTQGLDTDLHRDRLAMLRDADNLDVALNRAFTQTRASSLTDSAADRSKIKSEEHTSELQSLMRISYAVFCLKKKKQKQQE